MALNFMTATQTPLKSMWFVCFCFFVSILSENELCTLPLLTEKAFKLSFSWFDFLFHAFLSLFPPSIVFCFLHHNYCTQCAFRGSDVEKLKDTPPPNCTKNHTEILTPAVLYVLSDYVALFFEGWLLVCKDDKTSEEGMLCGGISECIHTYSSGMFVQNLKTNWL